MKPADPSPAGAPEPCAEGCPGCAWCRQPSNAPAESLTGAPPTEGQELRERVRLMWQTACRVNGNHRPASDLPAEAVARLLFDVLQAIPASPAAAPVLRVSDCPACQEGECPTHLGTSSHLGAAPVLRGASEPEES